MLRKQRKFVLPVNYRTTSLSNRTFYCGRIVATETHTISIVALTKYIMNASS